MNDITIEKIKEYLDEEIKQLGGPCDIEDLRQRHASRWMIRSAEDLNEEIAILWAIRRLIETRPRVTRDFVQRWAERMSFDTGSILGKVKPQIYQLEEMLKEAGVEMEEGYKEA